MAYRQHDRPQYEDPDTVATYVKWFIWLVVCGAIMFGIALAMSGCQRRVIITRYVTIPAAQRTLSASADCPPGQIKVYFLSDNPDGDQRISRCYTNPVLR